MQRDFKGGSNASHHGLTPLIRALGSLAGPRGAPGAPILYVLSPTKLGHMVAFICISEMAWTAVWHRQGITSETGSLQRVPTRTIQKNCEDRATPPNSQTAVIPTWGATGKGPPCMRAVECVAPCKVLQAVLPKALGHAEIQSLSQGAGGQSNNSQDIILEP